MNLHTCFLTENECYKTAAKHTPRGIMVHSTGANNPALRRYVQPDDGLLGPNLYGNDWNQARPGGQQVCVHAFIGLLADGVTVATYQTLPWDIKGWHSGSGSRGYALNANNSGYIGFEICEDGLEDAAYFARVFGEAAELCAHLCGLYGLEPEAPVLIDHSEGAALGIASNHGDVTSWLSRHGQTMDNFRAQVRDIMARGEPETPPGDMSAEQFDRLMRAWLEAQRAQPVSGWARDHWEEATERGLVDGSAPQSFATREQLAVVALKLSD